MRDIAMASGFTLAKTVPFVAAVAVLALPDYPPIPADKTTPVQQRIAFYSPSSVSVGWNTYEQLPKPCVKYGTSQSALIHEACSTSSITYDTSRTWSNAVILTGLQPATTYYYNIVTTNSTAGSSDFFTTARTAGDHTPFNLSVVVDLGVYGENGYTNNSVSTKRDVPYLDPTLNHTTIGALAQTLDSYEFVIHPGDFAYADDWVYTVDNIIDPPAAYESILENFYDQLAPVAARKQYMASPGNHEASCDEIPYLSYVCVEGQYNFTDFMNRFERLMPHTFPSKSTNATARASATKASSLALPPFWYSFEYGMAHITMIDTETDFSNAPDELGGSQDLNSGPFGFTNQQLEFLEADLASVDRSVTPWIIVAGHRPWYSTGGSSNICGPCQTAFEETLYKYGVDLAVFGHVHNSQRFNPLYNGTVDPAGLNNPKFPMYIVAGGAGNIEGLSATGSNLTGNVFVYSADYSYATLNFLDAQHLRVNFLRSRTGEVLDSSVLYKTHAVNFVLNN